MAKLELGVSRESKASSTLYPREFDSLDRQIIEMSSLTHTIGKIGFWLMNS